MFPQQISHTELDCSSCSLPPVFRSFRPAYLFSIASYSRFLRINFYTVEIHRQSKSNKNMIYTQSCISHFQLLTLILRFKDSRDQVKYSGDGNAQVLTPLSYRFRAKRISTFNAMYLCLSDTLINCRGYIQQGDKKCNTGQSSGYFIGISGISLKNTNFWERR